MCGLAVLSLLACKLFPEGSIAAQQEHPKLNEGSTVQATSPRSYADDVGNRHRIEIRPGTQDASVDAYLQHLLSQIKKSWLAFIPDEASNGRPAKVTVVFEIEPDGALVKGDPRIESSSGSVKLNQAAVYAIRYWRQYDRLPPGFQQPRLIVHADFSYNVGTTTQVEIPPRRPDWRVSATSSVPVNGSGAEILSDTQGVDFQNYIKRMLAAVKQSWSNVMPEEAKMGAKGVVQVTFAILPDGSLSPEDPQLEKISGNRVLDNAAVEAIRNSAPFEPLPHEFHGPHLKLRIIFFYNVKPEDAAREPGRE